MIWERRMMEQMIHGIVPGRDSSGDNDYSQWLEFAAFIVKDAADIYVLILRKLWRKGIDIQKKRKLIQEKIELEEFFHSEWYEMLTDIDPDRLIYQCRILAKEKEKADITRKNRRKVKKLMKEAE